MILNAKEFLTRLFLVKCHEICMHFGTEYVKNYVQQNFYVLGLRDALRSITCKYFDCRRFKGQGLQSPMVDLPEIRFPQNEPPVVFTNVGIDYIGPFTVIQRNNEEKSLYLPIQLSCHENCALRSDRRFNDNQLHDSHSKIRCKTGTTSIIPK